MVYGITSMLHLFSSYFHAGPRHKPPMETTDFRKCGKEMVEYVADYLENIEKRRVVPAVEPGYLKTCLPTEAPLKPEPFEKLLEDVEEFIMPGITHWQHPRFHAYFPAGNSFPSILADMLSDAIGCVGFSWAASPACTELETIMLDWLGKMIGLPDTFLSSSPNSKGGGVIQGSASECILVSLLAARFECVKNLRHRYPFVEEGVLLSKLVAYCSKEAHSSVEKACMIGFVKLRILETDERFRLRGTTLQNAIEEDQNMGLIPFFVSSTLGTTSCCSFDALNEIGPVCTEYQLWLHVDAAYAGSSFICPQFQYLLKGIEHAMSFNTNPNKWMLVNFDCSTMWVKDRFKLTQALVVDPLYLQHSYMDKAIDYRHWGIPLSRRFRALKLWFVIRMYGVEGLQRYVLEHVRLAKRFEQLVRSDSRFEVVGEVIVGLVCFRLKGSNEMNKRLLTRINASGSLHMVPCSLNNQFVIRFCVCAERATDRDVVAAWEIIRRMTVHVEGLHNLATVHRKLLNGLLSINTTDGAASSSPRRSAPEVNYDVSDTEDDEVANEAGDKITKVPEILTEAEKAARKRRSYFVRMVSDPKCYNPKIVRTLSHNRRRLSEDLKRDMSLLFDIVSQKDFLEDDVTMLPTTSTSGLQEPI